MVALFLIRHLRLSGEEEPPDDDGQNDDDEGETTGPTAGLPALGRPHPDVAYVPANCVARRRLAIRRRLRKRVD